MSSLEVQSESALRSCMTKVSGLRRYYRSPSEWVGWVLPVDVATLRSLHIRRTSYRRKLTRSETLAKAVCSSSITTNSQHEAFVGVWVPLLPVAHAANFGLGRWYCFPSCTINLLQCTANTIKSSPPRNTNRWTILQP